LCGLITDYCIKSKQSIVPVISIEYTLVFTESLVISKNKKLLESGCTTTRTYRLQNHRSAQTFIGMVEYSMEA
jgi:hypothetical protein